MEISSLKAFIEVAETASFSKAADRMNLTQPAVSKRVAALEGELSAILFNRIARKVSLTEAGKKLLPKAQELVNQAKELKRTALNMNKTISGSLSIAISHHIALYRMPPILKEFKQQYPEVRLDIRFEDSDQALSSVERGDIEFAVITLPSDLPDKLHAEVTWDDELYVVVGLDHTLASQKNVDLQELGKHPCVLPLPGTETHKIIQRVFKQARLEMQDQMHTNNLQSLKMLAVAGIGWSLIPKTMLDDDLVVLECKLNLSRQLGMVVHKKRSLSNAALALQLLITYFN